MAVTYIGIGTNLGNKEENLKTAISFISKRIGETIQQSCIFTSAPWGFSSNHEFLNMVIEVQTMLDPYDLLHQTQQIEKEMGRISKSDAGAYSDRVIDIDILFYDNLIIHDANLKIPHPLIAERDFVLIPLIEIAPDYIHPQLRKSLIELRK